MWYMVDSFTNFRITHEFEPRSTCSTCVLPWARDSPKYCFNLREAWRTWSPDIRSSLQYTKTTENCLIAGGYIIALGHFGSSTSPATLNRKKYFASSDPRHGIQFTPSDILSGKPSGILFGILIESLSVISSNILSGRSSDILSGISSDILSGISSDILSAISSDILPGISSDILSGISSDILSWILSGIIFGILYGFVPGRWGPVEVRRGPRCAESGRLKSGEAHTEVRQRADSRRLRSGEAQCDRELADEVRRGPLRSRAGRWGRARTTAIKSWQMRSGEDHCDQELADEVRRGPLRSRAGRWGPARTTAIKSWQRRSGEEEPRKEGRKGQLERGAAHLTWNLTILTWQVGKNCLKCVLTT